MNIHDILAAAKRIAARPDGLTAIPAFPALVAASLDQAVAFAQRSKRPALTVVNGHPVSVYPRGTKPDIAGRRPTAMPSF